VPGTAPSKQAAPQTSAVRVPLHTVGPQLPPGVLAAAAATTTTSSTATTASLGNGVATSAFDNHIASHASFPGESAGGGGGGGGNSGQAHALMSRSAAPSTQKLPHAAPSLVLAAAAAAAAAEAAPSSWPDPGHPAAQAQFTTGDLIKRLEEAGEMRRAVQVRDLCTRPSHTNLTICANHVFHSTVPLSRFVLERCKPHVCSFIVPLCDILCVAITTPAECREPLGSAQCAKYFAQFTHCGGNKLECYSSSRA
jgi:hypothetical protein